MTTHTHTVIDEAYHEEEHNIEFTGTVEECHEYLQKQASMGTMLLKIVPLTKDEIKKHNDWKIFKKILVIDNNLLMRQLTINALKRFGFQHFVEAFSYTGTVEFLDLKKVDLIIASSIVEKELFKFILDIRKVFDKTQLPILLTTTRNKKDYIQLLINSNGINDYIYKPFKEEVLTKKVVDIFYQQRKQHILG